MARRHLPAGPREGVRRRLEPLEQPERRSPATWTSYGLRVAADQVARRDVAGEGQDGKSSCSCSIRSASVSVGVRAHRDREAVEEPGQRLVEVVVDLQRPRLRERDRHLDAVDHDPVVRVVALHERPRAPHSDGVEHVEEVLGRQVVRVERHRRPRSACAASGSRRRRTRSRSSRSTRAGSRGPRASC